MDPADPPCIIQALRAQPQSSSALPPPRPPLVQALPAKDHPLAAAAASSVSRSPKRRPPPAGPAPPSPRRTRSGGAPEWAPAETLALVAEVAAVDDGWSRSVSAFQKWAMVAENLAASDAFRARRGSKRTAAECRRRWEALAAEYGAVRRAGDAYWEMTAATRSKAGLPARFDAEVYGAMDALIRVEEALLADAVGSATGVEAVEGLVGGGGAGGGDVGEEEDGGEAEVGEDELNKDDESADEEEEDDGDEGEEDEEEMQADAGNADDASNDSEGQEGKANNKTENSQNIAWELANKLQESAQHIHTVLNEEADGQNRAFAYSTPLHAMTTTRQKADELIKSLGGLLGYLNQFTELIKETGFENVGMT